MIKFQRDGFIFKELIFYLTLFKSINMTTPISKVKFTGKAKIFSPKYYKDELIALQRKGATTMVQIPGVFSDDPKDASKVVIGIDKDGKLMNGKKDIVVWPCPPMCEPPGTGGLITLSSFLT